MQAHVHTPSRLTAAASQHIQWLLGGFALGFLVPFVFADLLSLQRDVYYGVYSAFVFGFFALWARSTNQSLQTMIARRWVLAIVLGLLFAAVMSFIVLRQDATSRPSGVTLASAVMWRGVVYGAADGLLLSSFALRAVFAGFSGNPRRSTTIAGDAIWSIPTLVTLNPIAAPIAHIGLHVTAVLHSYHTDLFLPPH